MHECNLSNFKTKHKNALDQHLSFKHDIGVQWQECSYCDYKAKTKGDLKKDLFFKHDIGVI